MFVMWPLSKQSKASDVSTAGTFSLAYESSEAIA